MAALGLASLPALLALAAGVLAIAEWGTWGLIVGVPAGLASLYVLLRTVPAVGIAVRLTPHWEGSTLLRTCAVLPAEVSRELCRLVDLVRGRLGETVPGLDLGPCEVWIVAGPRQLARVRRASRVGLGRLGRPVALLTLDGAASSAAARLLAHDFASSAADVLARRAGPPLRAGLRAYLAVCAAYPAGAERSRALHEGLSGELGLREILCSSGALSRELEASCRSFTAFLVERYGLRTYLAFLARSDRYSPGVALYLAYGRTIPELETRWRVYLETRGDRRPYLPRCA